MKNMLLAVFVVALPLAAFAQKDSEERGAAAEGGRAAAAAAEELDIEHAGKLAERISGAADELAAAARAFIAAASGRSDTAEKAKDAGAAMAGADLEAAGVRLEELYDRAVRLRVKPAAKIEAAAAQAGERIAAVAVPEAMRGAAELRLRLANAQLEGGAAALSVVKQKINRAIVGQDSAIPAELVERLMGAAVEISKAKSALAKAAGRAAEKAAPPAAAKPAGKGG